MGDCTIVADLAATGGSTLSPQRTTDLLLDEAYAPRQLSSSSSIVHDDATEFSAGCVGLVVRAPSAEDVGERCH